jgi:hypothetical protein
MLIDQKYVYKFYLNVVCKCRITDIKKMLVFG